MVGSHFESHGVLTTGDSGFIRSADAAIHGNHTNSLEQSHDHATVTSGIPLPGWHEVDVDVVPGFHKSIDSGGAVGQRDGDSSHPWADIKWRTIVGSVQVESADRLGGFDLRLDDSIQQDAIALDDIAGQLRLEQLADRQVLLGDQGSRLQVSDGHWHID